MAAHGCFTATAMHVALLLASLQSSYGQPPRPPAPTDGLPERLGGPGNGNGGPDGPDGAMGVYGGPGGGDGGPRDGSGGDVRPGDDQRPMRPPACPAGYGISTQLHISAGVVTVIHTGCPPYSPYNGTFGNQTMGNQPMRNETMMRNQTITPLRNETTMNNQTMRNETMGMMQPMRPLCQAGNPFKVPATPIISSTVTWISITFGNGSTNPEGGVRGPIGLTMTGVAIYGDAEVQNQNATLDACNGRTDPRGTYHYYTAPGTGCAYNDTTGQHSPVFGVMADGIPLYGSYGDNGVLPTDLDECGGHTDSTYAYYHYHLPNGLLAPYTVRCLKGCLLRPLGGIMPPRPFGGNNSMVPTNHTLPTNHTMPSNHTMNCTAASVQYDYSSMVLPWVLGLPLESSPCGAGRNETNPPPRNTTGGPQRRPGQLPPGAITIGFNLTLVGVDYVDVTSNATKLALLKAGVCDGAVASATRSGVNNVSCDVPTVRPGSVVVQVLLTSTDNAISSLLQTAVTQLASDPSQAFPASFTYAFGVTSFTATLQSGSSDASSSSSSSASSIPVALVAGCVVGGLAGVVLIVGTVALVARRRKALSSVSPSRDVSETGLVRPGSPEVIAPSPVKPGQVVPSPRFQNKIVADVV